MLLEFLKIFSFSFRAGGLVYFKRKKMKKDLKF